MTTRAKHFDGAVSTADTKTTIGSAYKMPSGASRIVGILVAVGDEGVQEPWDSVVTLDIDDKVGPFEFVATMGGATASAASFQIQPAAFIPVDIEVNGGASEVTVSYTGTNTPEAVKISLIFE